MVNFKIVLDNDTEININSSTREYHWFKSAINRKKFITIGGLTIKTSLIKMIELKENNEEDTCIIKYNKKTMN